MHIWWTDLVLGVGQTIISDLHCDISRQQAVPQSQIAGDKGGGGGEQTAVITGLHYLLTYKPRPEHCRTFILLKAQNYLVVQHAKTLTDARLKLLLYQHILHISTSTCWRLSGCLSCSGGEGSPPATKSLMLESVRSTQAAPGYCSRKQPRRKRQILLIRSRSCQGDICVCVISNSRKLLLTRVWSCVCAGARAPKRCHKPSVEESRAPGSWILQSGSFGGNPSHPPEHRQEK